MLPRPCILDLRLRPAGCKLQRVSYRWVSRAWVAGLLWLTGCGQPAGQGGQAGEAGGSAEVVCASNLPSSADCGAATPSYERDVAPLISERCMPCHASGNTLSSVVLSDYAGVQKNKSPALTRLYRCEMPPSDALTLTDEARSLLLLYFVCGAPNN